MDNLNITMGEYIRLEEEKARRHGQTFNWQTATFRKVKNHEDEDDCFIDFETEFPTIVFDNTLTAIPSEPTVSIVYNDARTSKSEHLTEPIPTPQHIDEFNLIDETSLSEYDEENVLYFNDLFNIIHPDDLKSEKDNDDNDIDIIQSSEDNEITHGSNGLSETSHDKITKTFRTGSFVINLKVNIVIWNYYVNGMLFFLVINLYVPFGIPFDPKRYYKDGSHTKVAEAKDLAVRLRMVYSREGQQVFVSHAWRRLFGIRAPLVHEFILEFLNTCRMSDTEMGLDVADTLCFQLGGVRRRVTWRHFILALGLHTEQEMTEAWFGAYWDGSDRVIPDKGDLRDY
ncbi:hypothetical protein Tco_0703052 [Tanacetum coccineum]|uniref:Uncharacterized protein n=1 Tax=Tanacetum coccineum TaxID=301880 RepID=A0ABQ4XYA4_9ASTR